MKGCTRSAGLGAPFAALLAIATGAQADAISKVQCEITENGQPASGTIVLLAGGAEISEGTCGRPLLVPIGATAALLRLDGALDSPEQRVSLARSEPSQVLRANFATGLLEVHCQHQGRDVAGVATIFRDGKAIGTLGGGVAAHLSTGQYDVVVRYRTKDLRFEHVVIEAGRQTGLNARFDG